MFHVKLNSAFAVVGFFSMVLSLPAQTFTTLHSFDNTDGAYPTTGLIQGADGNFYGTTVSGGTNSIGTVFKIAPMGTLTTLHSFDGSDGLQPYGGLVLATNGDSYGTTEFGGPNCGGAGGDGTVFKITSSGVLTPMHDFSGTDGSNPYATLIQAADGDLYGTTVYGGVNSVCNSGNGTVFKMTPNGALTTLYRFCSQNGCTDGAQPYAGLVQAANGNFYGTTYQGG